MEIINEQKMYTPFLAAVALAAATPRDNTGEGYLFFLFIVLIIYYSVRIFLSLIKTNSLKKIKIVVYH